MFKNIPQPYKFLESNSKKSDSKQKLFLLSFSVLLGMGDSRILGNEGFIPLIYIIKGTSVQNFNLLDSILEFGDEASTNERIRQQASDDRRMHKNDVSDR